MKTQLTNIFKNTALALTLMATLALVAQTENSETKVANLRPYDQSGINVFEAPKDTNATFDKLKVNWGAGFTQSFQGLKHENAAKNLYKMSPGFNTANANLFMD